MFYLWWSFSNELLYCHVTVSASFPAMLSRLICLLLAYRSSAASAVLLWLRSLASSLLFLPVVGTVFLYILQSIVLWRWSELLVGGWQGSSSWTCLGLCHCWTWWGTWYGMMSHIPMVSHHHNITCSSGLAKIFLQNTVIWDRRSG